MFSALPFTIVKGIANSSIGEQLQQKMLKTKAAAQAAAGEAREAQSNVRNARYLFWPYLTISFHSAIRKSTVLVSKMGATSKPSEI